MCLCEAGRGGSGHTVRPSWSPKAGRAPQPSRSVAVPAVCQEIHPGCWRKLAKGPGQDSRPAVAATLPQVTLMQPVQRLQKPRLWNLAESGRGPKLWAARWASQSTVLEAKIQRNGA